jgi:hypothetical protein
MYLSSKVPSKKVNRFPPFLERELLGVRERPRLDIYASCALHVFVLPQPPESTQESGLAPLTIAYEEQLDAAIEAGPVDGIWGHERITVQWEGVAQDKEDRGMDLECG